eukprot:scaffold23928_cov54-Attheya_sp.AAC.2
MTCPCKVLPVFLFITLALIESCCKTSVAFSSSAKGRTFRVADYGTLSLLRFETQLHVAVGRLGKHRWGTLVDGRNQEDVGHEILLEVPPNLVTAKNNVKPSLTRRDTTVVSYKNGDEDDHSLIIACQPPLLMEDDVMVCLPSSSCAITQPSIPQLGVAVVVARPPREIDLPIRHEQQVVLLGAADTTIFESIESLMGRLAMVAAILFFVVEVSTGMSIPEQVSWLMT